MESLTTSVDSQPDSENSSQVSNDVIECCFDEWNSSLQVPLIKGKLSVSFSMVYNESDDDPVFKVISNCDRDWL